MWSLLWKGGGVYINSPDHMTKMATTPIYGEDLKIFSYRTNSPMIMKLGLEQCVLKLYKVYINDNPDLTLTYFTTMSNLTILVLVLIEGPDIG